MRILNSIVKPTASPPAVTVRTVWMGDQATAIVTVRRDDADRARGRLTHVLDLVELSAGVDAAATWLERASPVDTTIISDEGLGGGLWKALRIDDLRGPERRAWQTYSKHGRDRQPLLDDLVWARREGRLTSEQGLPGAAAMKKALLSNRTVGDDGVLGSELFAALALAVAGQRLTMPRVL